MKHILPFILIIRPLQWVKNLFVFLPMFFGGLMFGSRVLAERAVDIPGILAHGKRGLLL